MNRDPTATFLSLPFPHQTVLLLTTIELVLGLSFVGLGLWFASWISHPTAWGYYPVDHYQFRGALLYTFVYPIGLILSIDSIGRFATFRGLSGIIRMVILVTFGILSLVGGILALTSWDGEAYFTLETDSPSPAPTQSPASSPTHHVGPPGFNTNLLYESILAFELVWTWIPISITMFAIVFWYFLKDQFTTDGNANFYGNDGGYERFANGGMGSSPVPGSVGAGSIVRESLMDAKLNRCSFTYRVIILTFIIFILIPGLWVAATFLPGDWHEGYVYQIITSTQSKSYSEWTMNIKVGTSDDPRYMHVYFDVLVYYIGLFLTLTLGFIVKKFDNVSKILRKDLVVFFVPWINGDSCSCKSNAVGITILQLLVSMLWIGISVVIFIMFYWHHEFIGMSDGMNSDIEQATRTIGILATMYLGLAFIPVTRGNFINRYCLGLSFESAVKYHRFLGSLMGICAILHSLGWLFNFNKAGLLKHYYPFSLAPWNDYHADNFSLPLMWFVMIFSFVFLFMASWIEWIRRKFFAIWYSLHVYFAVVLVIGLMFHATNGWYFIIPGVALQFYERLYRLFVSTNEESIRYLEAIGTFNDNSSNGTAVTRLVINKTNKYPETPFGAYYFINIPNINPFEWHPFSASNSLNNNKIEFYIRRLGDWTNKLNDLATKASSSSANSLQSITVNVEGPYGSGLNYNNYDSIILVAGGIGITPFHNIFFTLYNEAQSGWKNRIPYVHLIWIVRYAEMFEMYSETFGQFAEYPAQNMKIHLFATKGQGRKNSNVTDVTIQSIQPVREGIDCALDWRIGRPDLEHELHFLAGKRSGALVYACGPESLVDNARSLAYKYGNHFKMETFKL